MTCLYADGFDWVDTTSDTTIKTQLPYDKWVFTDIINNSTLQGGAGLYGGKYIGFAATNAESHLKRPIGSSVQTVVVSFLFRSNAGLPSSDTRIYTLWDGTTQQVCLHLGSDGRLFFSRAGTTIGSATPAGTIVHSTWAFLTIKVKIDPSTGTVELRKDGGSALISGTGLNTRNSANSTVDGHGPHRNNGTGGTAAFHYDELYLLDTSGSVNNDFIALSRIEMVAPTSDDTLVSTPSTGVTGWAVLDEIPLSATADYTAFAAAGADLYNFADLASTPSSIAAVRALPFCLKTDAGAATARVNCKSSATTDNGTTQNVPISINADVSHIFELDPNGSIAWTGTNFNAAKFGFERVT